MDLLQQQQQRCWHVVAPIHKAVGVAVAVAVAVAIALAVAVAIAFCRFSCLKSMTAIYCHSSLLCKMLQSSNLGGRGSLHV